MAVLLAQDSVRALLPALQEEQNISDEVVVGRYMRISHLNALASPGSCFCISGAAKMEEMYPHVR